MGDFDAAIDRTGMHHDRVGFELLDRIGRLRLGVPFLRSEVVARGEVLVGQVQVG